MEGLVYRCDCCGASLKQKKKRLFTCGIYELPQCLGFSTLTREMIGGLQPTAPEKYETFLEEVGIRMVCYPESILADGNIQNKLCYSLKKRRVSMTVVVNYSDFVSADREEKACLVATALLQGIHLLQARLGESNLSIDDIVAQAEMTLNKYIT